MKSEKDKISNNEREIDEFLSKFEALDGDDGVGFLVNSKLPKMIADMEMLIEAGLGDGDGDQKVLSLRRR